MGHEPLKVNECGLMPRCMTLRSLPLLAVGAVLVAAAPLDLKTQMTTVVDPASKAFWAAGNDPPEPDTPAAAASRWAEGAKAATTLQETGRALLKAPYAKGAEWNGFAQKQVDAATAGAAAIAKKDTEAAFAAGGDMYEACNGCHAKFQKGRQ